jgi:ABC-type antimicrobial peptide transport system permease subunit
MGPCRIVGVVGHVKQWALDDSGAYIQNQAYLSLYQDPDQWVANNFPSLTAVVRTPLNPMTVMPAIKAVVNGEPVYHLQTMQEFVSESMSSQRFPLILLGAFALVALLLASVGTYGVISYSVAQRVHEIGIRIALGAEKRQIFQMVIGQGLRLAVSGLVIGAIAALFLTRSLSSFSHLLYGVRASDPVTFAAVSLMLTGVAILGCYIPARRASRVDPIVALRDE